MPRPPRALSALLATFAVLALVGACAPATTEAADPREGRASADAAPLERAAWSAWHYMELGRLEEGSYTTNALVDLELPQGTRWQVADFTEDGYVLRFLRVDEDGNAEPVWLVDPSGVRPAT